VFHKISNFIKYTLEVVKPIETAIIACLVWWSFILILPLDTFGSSKTYQAMAAIAREEVWSAVFFIVAVLNTYGMILERFKVRIVGLVLSNGLWIFVSAMFAIGNIATTGTGIYFIVACLNTYVIYKVGEQHGR
jgi:hypothetical protein